jgi:hypothetical protein
MDINAFLHIVRKRTPKGPSASIANPLDEVWRVIEELGRDFQGGLLYYIVASLATYEEDYDEGIAYALDLEYLPLVGGLIEARLSGEYPADDWRCRETSPTQPRSPLP